MLAQSVSKKALKSGRLLGLALIIVALVCLLLPPAEAIAAELTVDSTADSGSGSLRQAIATAGTGDTIIFDLPPGSTIYLTTGELVIDYDLNIIGPNADELTISGNDNSRVFHIGQDTYGNRPDVFIANLTIADGRAEDGGGIQHQGHLLWLHYCIIENNIADGPSASYGGLGGGIDS